MKKKFHTQDGHRFTIGGIENIQRRKIFHQYNNMIYCFVLCYVIFITDRIWYIVSLRLFIFYTVLLKRPLVIFLFHDSLVSCCAFCVINILLGTVFEHHIMRVCQYGKYYIKKTFDSLFKNVKNLKNIIL